MGYLQLLASGSSTNGKPSGATAGVKLWKTQTSQNALWRGTDRALLQVHAVAKSTGTLTLAGNAVADETVTIGSTVYTWKAAPTTVAFEVKVGATASDSIDNLIAAINLAAGAGTLYGSLTTAHPTVTAAAGAGDTMDVTGRGDTSTASTETMTQGSWGAATLTAAAGSLVIKLWGYSGLVTEWLPFGSGTTDADRGKLNEKTAIGEIDATDNELWHSEIVAGLRGFDRVYPEVVTATNIYASSINIYLVARASEIAA